MAIASKIEWTESTWNPVTGCTKISSGCKNCYAERLAKRLQAMGQPNYAHGFDVAIHESAFDLPLRWKRPQRVFVNSMSDLFHRQVPDSCIGHFPNHGAGRLARLSSPYQAITTADTNRAPAALVRQYLDGCYYRGPRLHFTP